jgi:anti-sigma B factor antagonist
MSVVDAHFSVVTPAGSYDCVVKADGEIDVYTAPQFRQVLADALGHEPRALTVDMADVSFMDSTGINALAVAFKQCETTGVELSILAPSPSVTRVLELTGLREVLHVIPRFDPGTEILDLT